MKRRSNSAGAAKKGSRMNQTMIEKSCLMNGARHSISQREIVGRPTTINSSFLHQPPNQSKKFD